MDCGIIAIRTSRLACSGWLLLLFSCWLEASSLTATQATQWAEGRLGRGLQGWDFTAAALVVVNARSTLASRAYGFADLETGQPASASATRFRVSSIGKLFTAVAVAQLLESGRIASLSDPINRYLTRLQVPDNDKVPISIHHLLTHSAGFDYWRLGLYTLAPGEVKQQAPGGADIARLMPGFVRPAGDWAIYSNFGGALLGVLVEDITGLSLETYLQQILFEPLAMRDTVLYREPNSSGLAGSYYLQTGGWRRATSIEFSPLYALSMGFETTASDMARFLRLFLNGGQLDGRRILNPQTVQLMLTQRFTNHPAANGFGMFFDVVQHQPGTQLFMHNGSTPGFGAQLILAPDHDLGFFVVLAGKSGATGARTSVMGPPVSAPRLAAEFVATHIGRFQLSKPQPPQRRAGLLTGNYVSSKRPLASPEALFDLFGSPLQVRVSAPEGDYVSNGRAAREVSAGVYMPAGPWAYREMFRWVSGEPVMVIYGSTILRRLNFWQRPVGRRNLLLSVSAFLLVAPLVLARRGRSRFEVHVFCLSASLALLLLVYPLYVAMQPHGVNSLMLRVQSTDLFPLQLAAGLAWLIALCLALQSCYCVHSWRISAWGGGLAGKATRMFYAACTLAGVVLCYLLRSLHLLVAP